MTFLGVLSESLREMGIDADENCLDKFRIYSEELKAWNQKIGLTALESDEEIAIKHFADSLLAARYVPERAFLMDIGSGAGFPGIPLKIIKPSIRVLLLDSSQKRVVFMKHILRLLDLKEITAVQQRAEDRAFRRIMARTVDVLVSRAFMGAKDFIEIAEPYIKQGGYIISMLGSHFRDALRSMEQFLRKKDLKIVHSDEFVLPRRMGVRGISVFKKS